MCKEYENNRSGASKTCNISSVGVRYGGNVRQNSTSLRTGIIPNYFSTIEVLLPFEIWQLISNYDMSVPLFL